MSQDSHHQHAPLSKGALPNAPYEKRPPSPPYIHVPSVIYEEPVKIVPSYDNVDTTLLTRDDIAIITQNSKIRVSRENPTNWKYEYRRLAQPVLEYLYLGPSSVAKDAQFLTAHGITMLIAVRDSMMAEARLMSVDRTAQSLGLAVEYIDVSGPQQLIRAFPTAVKLVNDHMVQVYRSQAVALAAPSSASAPVPAAEPSGAAAAVPAVAEGQMVIADNGASFRRGKVLIFCETGNDRSAAIVVAYIMAVFNMDLVRALQFLSLQRFCASLDEETKHWLRSYEDILVAKRMVRQGTAATDLGDAATVASARLAVPVKRRIEETMEAEDERMETSASHGVNFDMDRYTGRTAFTPFIDGDVAMDMGGVA